MARAARLAVADDALADPRPQPVRADERAARDGRAVAGPHLDAGAPVLEIDHLLAGSEVDERRALARLEQRVEEIGPVDDGIGMAVAVEEPLPERDLHHRLSAQGVADLEAVGEDRDALD